MAAVATADYDSDYDWDLSLEEESLLITQIQPPSSPPPAPTPTPTPARALAPVPAPSPAPSPAPPRTSARSHASSRRRNDVNAAFAASPARQPASPPLETDAQNHRSLSDLDPGFSYSHETSFQPRGPQDKASPLIASDGSTIGLLYTETSASPRPVQVPATDYDEEISYPDLSNALAALGPDLESLEQDPKLEREAQPSTAPATARSPLARFRTYPKKPLSVSDLTSGAWCELQHEYTLSLLPWGRKTRTPAMKEGTKVHEKLEEEVHVTVRVDITTKEDAMGLRLWNIVQGLRTLRETGLTRELEVWGIVDGEVVNGVIDALSYHNPDPEFEEEILSSQGSWRSNSQESQEQKITDYFPQKRGSEGKVAVPAPKIFITDIKTRAINKLPTGAAVRPAKIQLFLYHRFLADMAADKLDFMQVISRYGLDPDGHFSDSFMAQMGSLHDEIFYDAESTSAAPVRPFESPKSASSRLSTPDLLRYKTLRSLVSLLKSELHLTFPQGADSLGTLVTVEYRLRAGARAQADADGALGEEVEAGQRIGTNMMPVDYRALDLYLDDYMAWWRGERPAEGVAIEEAAYKCGYCEFAAACDWRKALDEERLRKANEKLAAKLQEDGKNGARKRRSNRGGGKAPGR